jgi:hypothetical protein
MCRAAIATDFAESRQTDMWLRHPVYGDPSFDAFERVPGNPICRGAPPFEWPVNGFLFHDPASGYDYIYAGDYCLGYLARPSRCLLYRSTDGARSWTNLGVVLHGDAAMFDQGGHTPDASVVYDEGRYHMIYDWGELDFTHEGGLAYAWAEKPEGPWHRAPTPITRNSTLPKLLGHYRRTYAGTLIRRRHDWLITAMMDDAPNRWALFVMTAPHPEGPWSERRLVRHVETDDFYPPIMEYFPAFTHAGFLYAPATSVALNRNFNVLFRVPLERACDPAAWQLDRYGSLWHSDDVENESKGLWGQTFSGRVAADGTFWAMFNSRDRDGFGTVNLARRPWKQPLRERGFVLSGHEGPAFTCLRKTFRAFTLDTRLQLRGTAYLMWNYRGALGPDQPNSDASLHPLMWTRFEALELSPAGWKVIRVDEHGGTTIVAAGTATHPPVWPLRLERKAGGSMTIQADGKELWAGPPEDLNTGGNPGALGLWVKPDTHLFVGQFKVRGSPLPARLSYLASEALLSAGEKLDHWEQRRDPQFRFGLGLVSKETPARVKWNVTGTRLSLWSPRGPDFGQAEIRLDGQRMAVVNLHADRLAPSEPVWTTGALHGRFHALVLQSVAGSLPVDCLEVAE